MRWLAFLLLAGCISTSRPIEAQPACITLKETVAVLSHKYGERLRGAGLTSNGLAIYLFRTDGGSSWTMVTFTANDCAVGSTAGEGWVVVVPVRGKKT